MAQDANACFTRTLAAWAFPVGNDITFQSRSLVSTGIAAGTLDDITAGVFGAGDNARFSNPAFLAIRNLSFEMLIRPTTMTATGFILRVGSLSTTTDQSLGLRILSTGGNLVWSMFRRGDLPGIPVGTAIATSDGTASVTFDQTYHAVFVVQENQDNRIYINGVAIPLTHTITLVGGGTPPAGKLTGPIPVLSTYELAIGDPSTTQNTFLGTLGRVVAYQYAVTAAQAMASYRLQLDQGLVVGIGGQALIGAANHGPVAVPHIAPTGVANPDGVKFVDINVAGRSFDANTDTLAVSVPFSPPLGNSSIVSGQVRYVPDNDSGGDGVVHTVPFRVTDPGALFSDAHVRVSVTGATEPPPPPGDNPSGLAWKSGVTVGESLSGLTPFATFRGRDIDISTFYTGGNFWGKSNAEATANLQWTKLLTVSDFNNGGSVETFLDAGIDVVYCQAMLVSQETGQFTMIKNGGRNAEHIQLANRIALWYNTKGPNLARLYMCFGQEANHTTYPWSYNQNPGADYALAYHNVAKIYKDRIGGTSNSSTGARPVLITWNGLYNSPTAINADPGSIIDVYTIDAYDNDNNGFYTGQTGGRTDYSTADWLGTGWPITNGWRGIDACRRFAAARSRKWGVQEWGPSYDADNASRCPSATNGTPNHDGYINAMWDYFVANKASLEFEVYFNTGITSSVCGSGLQKHQIVPAHAHLNLVRAAYLNKWTPP